MTIKESIKFLEEQGYVVISKVDYQRQLINEMTVDRQFIKNKAEFEFNNILENWCLLKYISLTTKKIELQNHWRSELITAIRNVWKYKLNNGNNRDIIKKAIENEYYDIAEYPTLDLSWQIKSKFDEENIIDADLKSISELFKDELQNIIELIAYGSEKSIYEYVQNV